MRVEDTNLILYRWYVKCASKWGNTYVSYDVAHLADAVRFTLDMGFARI